MSHNVEILYSVYKADGKKEELREVVSRGEKRKGVSPLDSVCVISYTPITGQYELVSEKKNPTAAEKKIIAEAKRELNRKFDGDYLDGA